MIINFSLFKINTKMIHDKVKLVSINARGLRSKKLFEIYRWLKITTIH